MPGIVLEEVGKRIARLRVEQGWTQQALADRLAISRVAVSHLEMDLTVPGERTVTLLAGLFKLEPHELVAGTSYPLGKAERLPQVACRYTELELQLALLRSDLTWLDRLRDTREWPELAADVQRRWRHRLAGLATPSTGPPDRELLRAAQRELRRATTTP